MYQHKQTRGNYSITVEFINGYLTSIAKLKDKLSRYLDHTYFFEEISKDGKKLNEIVADRIIATLNTFYQSNPTWNYDKKLYQNQFQNEMFFQEQAKWKESIRTKSKTWLGLHSEESTISYPARDCLIDNFIELIEDFLINKKFKMYLMEGDILNDLSHHWGGIGFQDFFFETSEHVYLIHFDYYD